MKRFGFSGILVRKAFLFGTTGSISIQEMGDPSLLTSAESLYISSRGLAKKTPHSPPFANGFDES